jgi:hypothetical protein
LSLSGPYHHIVKKTLSIHLAKGYDEGCADQNPNKYGRYLHHVNKKPVQLTDISLIDRVIFNLYKPLNPL